ncbi:hypothetical protein [Cytobacillus oceanisediminis]|nr:hypothetical protein [Cytobacillus oceanisediminis]
MSKSDAPPAIAGGVFYAKNQPKGSLNELNGVSLVKAIATSVNLKHLYQK